MDPAWSALTGRICALLAPCQAGPRAAGTPTAQAHTWSPALEAWCSASRWKTGSDGSGSCPRLRVNSGRELEGSRTAARQQLGQVPAWPLPFPASSRGVNPGTGHKPSSQQQVWASAPSDACRVTVLSRVHRLLQFSSEQNAEPLRSAS